MRDARGRFGRGNPGGPGQRPRNTPLHREITPERAEELWRERYVIATSSPDAERRDRAAEYILRYHTGAPHAQKPEVPAVPWGRIRTIEDVREALPEVFALHASGELDSAGLDFLLSCMERVCKILETIDLAPAVRELQEQLAAMRP